MLSHVEIHLCILARDGFVRTNRRAIAMILCVLRVCFMFCIMVFMSRNLLHFVGQLLMHSMPCCPVMLWRIKMIDWLIDWCSSLCPTTTGVRCDHTVHVSVELSLWLDSPIFWTPWHWSMSTYSQPSFPVPPGREVGMDVQIRRDISRTVEDRG